MTHTRHPLDARTPPKADGTASADPRKARGSRKASGSRRATGGTGLSAAPGGAGVAAGSGAPAGPGAGAPAASVPYYARNTWVQREREGIVRLVNRFGTHLICGRKTCRRARTCTDEDMRTLPRCFWQHRGAIRMIAMAAIERHGLKDAKRIDQGPNPPPLPPMSKDDPTVLGLMRERGRPIHLLEKPVDAADDPWCHEYHPHAVATYGRLVGREPG